MGEGSTPGAVPQPQDATNPGPEPLSPGAHGQRDTPTAHNSLLGARIGNLEIECTLGHGSFGTVYKARDVKLGRTVAVKFLTNPAAARHLELFEREAKAIAALGKHPSIVQVFSWGEHDGIPYFVLEYAWRSVADLLEQHPEGLSLEEAVGIAAACAEGLAHAHGMGVLHRDIKPSNILLKEDGTAQLADFGLARFEEVSPASLEGNLTGSPPYMSPEQAAGRGVDGRSDVFSLGVTLYEMLSGRRPFEGKTILAVLERIRQGDSTPLRAFRPDLPERVHMVVGKAIAHAVDDRFPTAGAFGRELRDIHHQLKRTGIVEGKAPRHAAGRFLRPVIAAAIIALAISGLWLGTRGRFPAQSAQALAEAQELLESRQPAAAADRYRALLADDPEMSEAGYGLGYALLQQGDTEKARLVFDALSDVSLREEGLAAVALVSGSAGEAELDVSGDTTGYARVIEAKKALQSGAYAEAREAVAGVIDQDFPFEWQQREALRTLAQAQYRLGNNEEAARLFNTLAKGAGAEEAATYAAYGSVIRQREERALRDEVRTQAQRIRELLDAESPAEPVGESGQWTSRRLAFFVAPLEGTPTAYALETGLSDVLPLLLGQALERDAPRMQGVDRENLAALLQEQELSGQLAQGAGRLALGRFLGARLMVSARFAKVGADERLLLQVSDTETLETWVVPAITVSAGMAPDALIEAAADAVRDAVENNYPLQARVYQQKGQAYIDIGRREGVAQDTTFEILAAPALAPLADVHVVVRAPVGLERTQVQVFGAETSELPEDPTEGWYARARVLPDNT